MAARSIGQSVSSVPLGAFSFAHQVKRLRISRSSIWTMGGVEGSCPANRLHRRSGFQSKIKSPWLTGSPPPWCLCLWWWWLCWWCCWSFSSPGGRGCGCGRWCGCGFELGLELGLGLALPALPGLALLDIWKVSGCSTTLWRPVFCIAPHRGQKGPERALMMS